MPNNAIEQKIKDLITRPTSPFNNLTIVDLETSASGNVSGLIATPIFNGKDQSERQAELWELLRAGLDEEERTHITAILTLTPEEIGETEVG